MLAPHKGFVPSSIWLKCRKKLMNNTTFQSGRKARNTWMAGKVKCGRCGYALMSVGNSTGTQYLRCSKRADNKSCEGCGKLKTHDFESFIFGEMAKKMGQFESLIGGNEDRIDPRITALQIELAQVDEEIEKLLDTLSGANPILLSYANSKIETLDTKRQNLVKEIADLSAEVMSPRQIRELSNHIHNWENISFENRRKVIDGLITQIKATSEYVQIEWKI